MPLPRWVAHFNKKFTNRFMEPVARRFSNFCVVHHRGRRSGHSYTTPVNYFTDGDTILIALTYGPSADWVKNVMAEPGLVETGGRRLAMTDAEIVGRPEAWATLPRLIRIALRLMRVHHFFRANVQLNSSQ